MVFSSPVFLFVFFPLFFGIYFLLPKLSRNAFVLFGSFGFYLLGTGALTAVAVSMLILNWLLAMRLWRLRAAKSRDWACKITFALTLVMNLAPLLFFKYFKFSFIVLNDIFSLSVLPNDQWLNVALPLGISFYTFHFVSYISDIYSGKIQAEKNLSKFAIYIFLFPHMIAGPIVRYSEVKQQLDIKRRKFLSNDIFWGLVIFIIGLSKKILVADPLGVVSDSVHHFSMPITTYSAWLAAFCYSFQIYFDFSGYTDMAIGMARMMGFRFPKNFNRPYASRSIIEFWQRWHMTLSRWFRDYVYIPLGGNRESDLKTYRNLLVVFVLCALWHGAAYTFLIWGVGHGILIVLERSGILKLEKLRLGNIPVFILATLLWIPFRAESLDVTQQFAKAMFILDSSVIVWADENRMLADPKVIFLLVLASVICLVGDRLFYKLRTYSFRNPRLVSVYTCILYLLVSITVVERGFNPFIYFQF